MLSVFLCSSVILDHFYYDHLSELRCSLWKMSIFVQRSLLRISSLDQLADQVVCAKANCATHVSSWKWKLTCLSNEELIKTAVRLLL